MEQPNKIKAKIPIKKADGSFEIVEGEEYLAPDEIANKPESTPLSPISRTPYKPTLKPDQRPAEGITTDFIFDKDDEQDVRAEKEKLKQFGTVGGEADGERVAKEIIAAHNLSFTEEIFRKRLVAIVNSRLKDVRDSIQTKDMLMRETKVGGMGYDSFLSDKISAKIEAEAIKLHGRPLPKEHEEKAVPPPPAKPKPPVPQEVKKPEPIAPVIAKAQPKIAQAPKPIQPSAVKPAPSKLITKKAHPSIPQVRRPTFDAGKPRVEDIKSPTKVMSPVDEIREMSLVDFQRLGQDPIARIDKLTEKIDLLQEESYAKKVQGIVAWKQSAVYRLYLEIGQQSMNQAKSVTEIINIRKQQGLPVISFNEFQMIADFNKSLRF